MKNTKDNIWKIERWEDIPKVKHKKKRKIPAITEELKEKSTEIVNYKKNEENKSLIILEKIYNKNVKKIRNKEDLKPHKDLYNILCDKEILRLSYKKIANNKGAMTPGVVNITATDINESFINKLSKELKERKFKWNPAKRIYIEKPGKNNKKRPLGINDYKNKIVQESIRMILEIIFEPSFDEIDTNTGFRPNRDCAYSIEKIKRKAQFADIVIEGDIVGAYDNVNHDILMELLKRRIRDNKFLDLIHKGLKAGIMEDKTYSDTFLGIPQGSICSPILFNIYMHEFDLFILKDLEKEVNELNENKNKSERIAESREHRTIRARITNRRKKLDLENNITHIQEVDIKDLMVAIDNNNIINKSEEWPALIDKGRIYAKKRKANKNIDQNAEVIKLKNTINNLINEEEKNIIIYNKRKTLSEEIKIESLKLKLTEYKDPEKTKIKMFFQRYADDWTLWLRCTKNMAAILKERIKKFLKENLKLDLSEEKTKITILKEDKAKFLGFSIYKKRNKKLIRTTIKAKSENRSDIEVVKGISTLTVDLDRDRLDKRMKLDGLCTTKKYFDKKNVLNPSELPWLAIFEAHQIIEKFNQFMLGFGNYYITVINEPSRIGKYIYIYYYSCLKTLCQKFRISIKELVRRHGYIDISEHDIFDKNFKLKKNKKYNLTDKRICIEYTFDNKKKWMTLLNYKELMFKLRRYRNIYRKKINGGHYYITPQIDFFKLYKLNFRTKYKMTSHCLICGCNDQDLHNHHIKKLKHGGNKHYTGYKAFDKVIASLGRKQITICKECHDKVHNGTYDKLNISDLYDIRLATPETYIKNFNKENDQGKDPLTEEIEREKEKLTFQIIDKKERTYWKSDYSEYLINKKKRKEKKILTVK